MAQTTLRVLDSDTVRALLPYDECIEVIRRAMITTSEGRALLPLRHGMPLPNDNGALGMMPGYLGEPECFGIKLVSLFPGNRARGLSSHLGAYLLYDATSGAPLALMNASELTAIRTAAASAVATLALMHPDSRRLAILGTGEQARAHAAALLTAHPFEEVRIWGRGRTSAATLAQDLQSSHRMARPTSFVACSTAREAVVSADVVCTVTSSNEPIVQGAWLKPGTHVNLVGASFPDRREIDEAGVLRSRYFVDYRASALAQAGELLDAISAGKVTATHIVAEIGKVLAGEAPGRLSPADITIYKSLGIAAQDLAAAWHVMQGAERRGLGVLAPL